MLLTLSEKGKHASGTYNRRFVWAQVVWPLVLEVREAAFTLEQYHAKRDQVCRSRGVGMSVVSRGLASLIQKGLVIKEGHLYSIHYKLIPYMRLGARCDYARAIYEVKVR